VRYTQCLRSAHWFVLLGLLVVLGVLVSATMRGGEPLPGDLAIARELQEQRPIGAVVLPLMVLVSAPGYDPWPELLLGLALGWLLLARRWTAAVLVAATVLADLLAAAIKLVVERPRPTPDLVEVYRQASSYSFPSGHVVHYVAFFGVLGYLAWRGLGPRPPPSRRQRLALQVLLGLCCALIVLVGPSRVYLGAHWPTDVLGGYVIGSACLVLLIASAERLRRSEPVVAATPTGDHRDVPAG
jgi:membrane-associated phospholipid phosphatase